MAATRAAAPWPIRPGGDVGFRRPPAMAPNRRGCWLVGALTTMRVIHWNPLSLSDRDRELEVAYEYNHADVIIIVGTQRRTQQQCETECIPHFRAIHFWMAKKYRLSK